MRMADLPPFVTLASDIDLGIIRQNFDRFVFSEKVGEECLWRLMMDDVKVEKRLRVDLDSKVRGLCYHAHTSHLNLEIKGEADIDAIKDAPDNGTVHYTTELTTVAIGPIRKADYGTKAIATSGACLSRDPRERTQELVALTLAVWTRDPRGQAMRGRLTTMQADGAATFVKISQEVFFGKDMGASHPLHDVLKPLVLFCKKTGEGIYEGITNGCEQKHDMKRLRERLKGPTGVTFFKHTTTGGMLRRLLAATGYITRDLDDMFATGFIDAMNVTETVNFLRAVASLRGKSPDDFGERKMLAAGCYDDLQLMALFCGLWATQISDKRPSLSEHLTNISTMIHIAFAAHRRNKTKFLANQTFLNLQRMLRSIYWSVASAIVYKVPTYFLFMDSGDALEIVFNIETLPPLPETQDGRRPTLRRTTLCGDVNEVTIASALRIKMRANQQGSLESGRIARYRDQMKAGQ
ncbi:hypothetical protein M885DRAFT_591237, partial [Pelagophyceae sp. CCMP2097]